MGDLLHATQIFGDDPDDKRASKRDSQATTIVCLVNAAGAELFHTPGGDCFIKVQVAGHHEQHQLGSRASRDFLTRLFYLETGKAPNATALQDALATLSGIARFDGAQRDVHARVAGADGDEGDARIYIDLCDSSWRAVEVNRDGWQVVTHPSVCFRRAKGMLPLPVPVHGGSLKELRPFINVAGDDDFRLIVAWLLAALRPGRPYPILVFMAEQGAAKTTTTRVLRRLVDPNESDVRRPPRNAEDLMIAATNGHVVAYDNLSRLSEELSDNLSVLATGGGFAVRQLYTNNEEQIFQAQRPIILNGIAQVATRGDLLDRAIVLTLPAITESRRKDEATFWAEFELARPRILGGLLDAVSMGLRRVSTVRMDCKPRMADFAIWGVAVEPACPWATGAFLAAYSGNRQGAIEATLDGDPLVDAIRKIAPWMGTAAELLKVVTSETGDHITRTKSWYAKPKQISDALRRLAPALRRTGIETTFRREAQTGRRIIQLEKVGPPSSPASPSSPEPETCGLSGDAASDAAPPSSPLASPPASPKNTNVYGLSDAGDAGDAAKPVFSAATKGEVPDGRF